MRLGDLFEKIEVFMPADRPGQLTMAQNADILSYILKFNQFPVGPKDLAGGRELHDVRFEVDRRGQ